MSPHVANDLRQYYNCHILIVNCEIMCEYVPMCPNVAIGLIYS